MKSYVSSVIYRKGNECILRVPKYLCESIGMPDSIFYANLFVRENVPDANRIELVISPYRRNELLSIYNMRMRLKNEAGSTQKMLSILKDPDVFGMDVYVITGIDSACPTSGEVEIIGRISDESKLKKDISGKYIQHFKINQEISKRAENLLHQFRPVPAVKVSGGKKCLVTDIDPPDEAKFFLLIEKCYRESDYPIKPPFWAHCDNLSVKIEASGQYYLLKFNADGCCPNGYDCARKIFNINASKTPESMYTFVTVRLDSERNALAILLKHPVEKIYAFNLTFKPNANIAQITDLLSNKLGLDFRSISSVNSADRSITVDIAANVTGTLFEGIHKTLMEHYLRMRNEREELQLKDIRIGKVFEEHGREYPTCEEERYLFCIRSFAIVPVQANASILIPKIGSIELYPQSSRNNEDIKVMECCTQICKELGTETSQISYTNFTKKYLPKLAQYHLDIDPQNYTSNDSCVNFTAVNNSGQAWFVFMKANVFLMVSYSGLLSTDEELSKSQVYRLLANAASVFRLEELVDQLFCTKLYQDILQQIVDKNLPTLRIRKLLDRFSLTKELGRGHFGTVYKAFDEVKKAWRALKLTETELTHKEFQILTGVKHPCLLEYLEFKEHDGRYIILMELIRGVTFEKLLSNKTKLRGLSLADKHAIMNQVLDGIKVLHDAKILHLDLKPDNLMLLDDGGIKILDFGLAGSKKANSYDWTISRRNAAYIAPEFHKRETAMIHDWTDLFALGIVFYEMLFYTHPYPLYEDYLKGLADTPTWIHLRERVEPRMHKYNDFFQKALSIDYRDRYQSVKEMKEGLEHISQ